MTTEQEMKACRVCGVEKPLSEFHLKADKRKGKEVRYYYDYLCYKCKSIRDKNYKATRVDRDRERAKIKTFIRRCNSTFIKKTDAELKEQARIYAKKRYYDHHLPIYTKGKNRSEVKKTKEKYEILTLSDEYVKSRIQKAFGLSYKNISEELINSYRMQIKVKRTLKHIKDEDTTTCKSKVGLSFVR